jgi:hypothetical protein
VTDPFRTRDPATGERVGYPTGEAARAAADASWAPLVVEYKVHGAYAPWPPWPVVTVADLAARGLAEFVPSAAKGGQSFWRVSPAGHDALLARPS